MALWGECEQAAQWFGNAAEFEQGQNRCCCQHHMIGKQRVATAVFSQHHISIRWYCIALFRFNYHLQYFELCV